MTQPETHTLDVPGAVLHYDVRGHDASTQPVLLLIASPMGADGFTTLAGHFADRTVVTYDKKLFVAGVAGFLVSSLFTGLAPTPDALIASRATRLAARPAPRSPTASTGSSRT